MAITRREALTAAAACGAATTATAAPIPPTIKPLSDPLFSHTPKEVRAVLEDTFPLHLCIRLAERWNERRETVSYRATVFNPASRGAHTQLVNGELVSQPILYHIELTPKGTVVEETPRPILDLSKVPKVVMDSYRKWNPHEVRGMTVSWITQVPRGGERTYSVGILMSAIKAYGATFKLDGTILSADPPVVPPTPNRK